MFSPACRVALRPALPCSLSVLVGHVGLLPFPPPSICSRAPSLSWGRFLHFSFLPSSGQAASSLHCSFVLRCCPPLPLARHNRRLRRAAARGRESTRSIMERRSSICVLIVT
eukprot:9484662-Pyramimonas_sp.AAC.1